MKDLLKQFFLLNVGAAMDAGGFYFFLAPNKIAAGGVNGLAVIINHYFAQLPLGLIILVLSILLLLAGFFLVGLQFAAKTVYTSLMIPALIWLLELYCPLSGPLSHDMLIQLIFGVSISGIGLAILFNQNASSGGTDIAARILRKYYHIDLGKALFLIDFLTTILAGISFGLDYGMYALLGIVLYTFIIDYAIDGLTVSKHVTIISRCSDEIRSFIIDDIGRGATLYAARGGFTGQEHEIIVTILNRREFIRLRDFIRELDPDAFTSVQNVHEVFGEGFSSLD